ncbi:MAG: glycoside hydrolase family 127 protein [Lachnospiraceae bacterium]|nr:glycoside hydrolase family 127 protein [Lachnospiraceae bacterium]
MRTYSIDLADVRIDDAFWNKYIRLVTKEIIPYQWNALNDRVEDADPSHCISNFQIAAGLKEGDFEGWVFQDTDLAKWLEAVAYSLSYEPNQELEAQADAAIELIGKAQEENGYLNTYFSIKEPGKQFKNLKEGHELYTAGHMIEAAVAYYKVTGKDAFLKIVRKNADLICDIFHTKPYENAVPGHEEIELALVKLYEVTGEKRYLQMAKDFVDRRGTRPNYLSEESSHLDFVDVWHDANPYVETYGQSHLPVRQQKTAEGHAVRAMYLYSAMADLADAYDDGTLLEACEMLYQNVIGKRMYITGGIGSSGFMERFTTDYDLPNVGNYSESCASIGLAMFTSRMAQITRDASYIETMERALMNTVLSGIAMDGKSFFYVNPMEVWPPACMDFTSMGHVKAVRQKWFGCACCPPNIARTLASLGEYASFVDSNQIYINLLLGAKYSVKFGEQALTLTAQSELPWNGKYALQIHSADAKSGTCGTVSLRIPTYAVHPVVTVNKEVVSLETEKGYLNLNRYWKDGDVIELSFEMPPMLMHANPLVRADAGKVCIVKGPLVYCLEETDNGENLASLYVEENTPLEEFFESDLLGGVTVIKAKGKRICGKDWIDGALYEPRPVTFEDCELTFVPYCNWGNRKTGEMLVWVNGMH